MSEETLKIIALVLFGLMYVGIICFSKAKMYVALAVAVVYVALGVLPLGEVPVAINWNALMMIAGTMLIVYYFIESQMPTPVHRIATIAMAVRMR